MRAALVGLLLITDWWNSWWNRFTFWWPLFTYNSVSAKRICDRFEQRGVKTIPGWCKSADLYTYKLTKVVWKVTNFSHYLVTKPRGNGCLLNRICKFIHDIKCLSSNWPLERDDSSIISNTKAASAYLASSKSFYFL